MIPCDKSFKGKEYYVDAEKTIYRWYTLNYDKPYIAKFRKIITNSNNKQAIALFFSDFEGNVYINKQKVANLKGFKHYLLREEYFESEELELYVMPEKGHLFFGNASEHSEINTFTCGAFGCAYWIEKIDEFTQRFHCNDHEYDDDFDDFVFELKITRELTDVT